MPQTVQFREDIAVQVMSRQLNKVEEISDPVTGMPTIDCLSSRTCLIYLIETPPGDLSTTPFTSDQSVWLIKPPTEDRWPIRASKILPAEQTPWRCTMGTHTPTGAGIHCLTKHQAPARSFDLCEILRHPIHNQRRVQAGDEIIHR